MTSRPDDPEVDTETPNSRDIAEAAQRLQEVGARLLELSSADLADMPISEALRDAVHEAHRLQPGREAMRRQIQLIGRLIRSDDGAAIEKRLEHILSGKRSALLQRTALAWTRRLLEEGDATLNTLIGEFPGADRQRVRQLMRNASKLPAETPARKRAEQHLTAELRTILRSSV